jgi:hypothetical protein
MTMFISNRMSLEDLLSELWDRRSVFVVCLLPGAGPSPLCRSARQSSSHRILLHIANEGPQFGRRTNPVILRLILPKRHPRAPQNLICRAARSPLQPSHDGGQFADNLPNHMDKIGHDHPCMEAIESADRFAVQECFGNHACDSRVLEPVRTAGIARRRSCEPPGDEENRIVRNPVGEVSAAKEHGFVIRSRQTTENRWSVPRLVSDLLSCSL